MADKIACIIYALLFVTPLLFSALCLLKVVLVDWPKKKNVSLIVKLSIIIPVVAIALFLIYFIIIKFVFPDIGMPIFFNIFGIVLFFSYFFLFFGISYGIATLAHGGLSPGVVIQELYKLFFRKEENKRGGVG